MSTVRRFLRLPLVLERAGLSKPTWYHLMQDGKAPKPVNLGGGRAVGWLESDIEEWITGRLINADHASVRCNAPNLA